MTEGNGSRGQEQAPQVIITVTDRDLFAVNVGGVFPTLDYALNMLDQARRELEAQWRLARASQVVRQAQDRELAQRIGLHRS